MGRDPLPLFTVLIPPCFEFFQACWPMMSWLDVGVMVENIEAAEGQSDKIVPDIEMCMKMCR